MADGSSMGLPEVMIGLLPGAGGTQKLPQMVLVLFADLFYMFALASNLLQ